MVFGEAPVKVVCNRMYFRLQLKVKHRSYSSEKTSLKFEILKYVFDFKNLCLLLRK